MILCHELSIALFMTEPLTPEVATKLAKAIVKDGTVTSSKHGSDEMGKDALTLVDCVNVLRAGSVREPADLDWRDLALSRAHQSGVRRRRFSV